MEGVPGFITMTHRDNCTLCEQYTKHTALVSEKLTVEILSHWIELSFWMAWPCMVAHIEDDAVDEAMTKYHGITSDTKTQLKTQNCFRSNSTLRRNTATRWNLSCTTSERREKVKESREKSLLHMNGMSGSPPQTLTLLSKHSARHPGNNSATTQACQTFFLRE